MPLKVQLLRQQKPLIKKPKLLRSNPTRYILVNLDDNDDGFLVDDESIYVGYRKPELVKEHSLQEDDDAPLSDYVLARLAQARAKAMEAYNAKWATS